MNILFTVCGRAGSKGFKNKNLKDFLGKPLIWYSIAAIDLYEKALPEQTVDVALNTDSKDLIEIATRQKAVDLFAIERDASLGGDTVPKVAVITDCLVRSEEQFNRKYDLVVDLDNTSPLRTVKDIENAINEQANNPGKYDVVYSVTGARRNPYFNQVEKQEDGYYSTSKKAVFTARQQAPAIYDMNASIYAYSPVALWTKEAPSFFKSRCGISIMMDTAVLDIDGEEDFELMQILAEYFYKKYSEYGEIYNHVLKM